MGLDDEPHTCTNGPTRPKSGGGEWMSQYTIGGNSSDGGRCGRCSGGTSLGAWGKHQTIPLLNGILGGVTLTSSSL